MRIIKVKLFKFDELSEDAKREVLNDYTVDTSYYWEEAHETVKEFHKVFGTRDGNNSWLDFSVENIDDSVLELTGFRLQKFLWNNFGDSLFTRKYLKDGGLSDKIKKYHRMQKQSQITNNCPNKDKFSISYYSNIQKENCCVLTGVCYDEDILKPIYNFLESREVESESTTFEDLLGDCLFSLKKSLESEDDYRNSDEGKAEDLLARDDEYLIDGRAA